MHTCNPSIQKRERKIIPRYTGHPHSESSLIYSICRDNLGYMENKSQKTCLKWNSLWVVVVHTFKASTREAGGDGSRWIGSSPGLHSETLSQTKPPKEHLPNHSFYLLSRLGLDGKPWTFCHWTLVPALSCTTESGKFHATELLEIFTGFYEFLEDLLASKTIGLTGCDGECHYSQQSGSRGRTLWVQGQLNLHKEFQDR